MASARSSGSDPDGEPLAVSADARRDVIEQVIDLPEGREPRSLQTRTLLAIYGALIRRRDELSKRLIRPYFIGASTTATKQGFYSSFSRWWAERGEQDVLDLPGVEKRDGCFAFTGVVDPSDDLPADVDTEDATRPLEAFRADPRVKAHVELVDRYGPHAEAVEDVLALWDVVATAGSTTSEEITRDPTLDLSGYADALADLPGIERTVDVTDPEEITVETYADVLNARQEIDAPPTVRWRFDPEG